MGEIMNKQLRQHLPGQLILFLTYMIAKLRGAKVHPTSVIYPTAQICRYPRNVAVGRDSILKSGAKLTACNPEAYVSIGERTTVGEQSLIYASCNISIGNDVMIGPRLYVVDTQHGTELGLKMNLQKNRENPVIIGDDCWIGANVTILPGVKLGNGCVVGAGSVVLKDVPDYTVVAGVPARVIRKRVEAENAQK